MDLPAAYLERMKKQLGNDFPAYLASMDDHPKAALRVNTLKTDIDSLRSLFPGTLNPLSGAEDGFLVDSSYKPGSDPLHAAGLYYMQEASAQMPARLPSIPRDAVVLDLCASPGGKSTQLAARMQGNGVLVANEYVPSRVNTLIGNLERLGVKNAIVTNMDTHTLCARLERQFDVVLCDAPCAGEGMFRKNPTAVAEWSLEHVAACALRERGILENAAAAVKNGGSLVYSTCSFSEEEDEALTRSFLASRPDFSLLYECKLFPHNSDGEGQYMASFIRDGMSVPSVFQKVKTSKCASWDSFQSSCDTLNGTVLRLKDGRVLLLPALPFSLDGLRISRAGLLLGEDKGNRFQPSHALAMASPVSPVLHKEPLSEEETSRYLRGETIPRNTEKGWCVVTYQGYALGLAKSDGTILKNHYPAGLRRFQ